MTVCCPGWIGTNPNRTTVTKYTKNKFRCFADRASQYNLSNWPT